MKLKEEKLIIISEILLVLITLCSIIIEISDYKLSEWNSELLNALNVANNNTIIKFEVAEYEHFFVLLSSIIHEASLLESGNLDISMSYMDQELRNKEYFNPIMKDLADKFYKKEISQYEYVNKMITAIFEEYSKAQKLYEYSIKRANFLMLNGPPIFWNILRNILPIIQIILILIVILIYSHNRSLIKNQHRK